MGERIRTLAVALILLVVLCGVGGAIASFVMPDFGADINRVFVTRPSVQGITNRMNWCEDCDDVGVTAQLAAGSRLALLGLLVIGIPLGMCAKALAAGNRRAAFDRQWGSIFQMGFVFQLGSLLLAAAILLLLAPDGFESYRKAPVFFFTLVGDVGFGIVALPSWRSLQESERTVAPLGKH